MKVLFFFSISISLVACFSAKIATEPVAVAPVNLEKATIKYPGYNNQMYEDGKNLYESNCQSCHGLKNPLKFTEEQWKELVPSMSAKANKHKDAQLSKEDEDLILKYVVTQGL